MFLIGPLILFAVLGLGGLTRIMTAEQRPYAPRDSGVAAVPHSPKEFPRVFDFDPLEGIRPGSKVDYPHPKPPISADMWPCSQCHEKGKFERDRRRLSYHEDIRLRHGDKERWCLDCHDYEDRDKLRLASGTKISFDESHRLCGQCHGPTYRDWKKGIHGKRTGYWNGAKRYLLCVYCHWPHEPHFKALEPLPPPVRPEYYRPGSDRDGAEARYQKYREAERKSEEEHRP